MATRAGQDGPTGTGREFWPLKNRHSPDAIGHECEQVRRLFHSWDQGRGARNHFDQLEPLFKARVRGHLAIQAARVAPEVLAAADRDRACRRSNRASSTDHEWLREIGLSWMDHRGTTQVHEEYRSYGYRYDLAAPAPRIIVECGNTNCDSAIYALMDKPEWEYWLIPFSSAASRRLQSDGEPSVYMFRLWLTDAGKRMVQDDDGVNIFPWFSDGAFPSPTPCEVE
jgi:hypothetical protein